MLLTTAVGKRTETDGRATAATSSSGVVTVSKTLVGFSCLDYEAELLGPE